MFSELALRSTSISPSLPGATEQELAGHESEGLQPSAADVDGS